VSNRSVDLDIITFYIYCTTAHQVRHIALSITPHYAAKQIWFDYEYHNRLAMHGFLHSPRYGNPAPGIIPSITLIPGDIVADKIGDTVDRGPPTGIDIMHRMDGSRRRACSCHYRDIRERTFALDTHLRQTGQSIPNRSGSCAECEVMHNWNLRVGTVSRFADEQSTTSCLSKLRTCCVAA
jgi:hypothetical protein